MQEHPKGEVLMPRNVVDDSCRALTCSAALKLREGIGSMNGMPVIIQLVAINSEWIVVINGLT